MFASFNHYPAPDHINNLGLTLGGVAWLIAMVVSVWKAPTDRWWLGLLASMGLTSATWSASGFWVETYARGDMTSPLFAGIIFGVLGLIVGAVSSLVAIGVVRLIRRLQAKRSQ